MRRGRSEGRTASACRCRTRLGRSEGRAQQARGQNELVHLIRLGRGVHVPRVFPSTLHAGRRGRYPHPRRTELVVTAPCVGGAVRWGVDAAARCAGSTTQRDVHADTTTRGYPLITLIGAWLRWRNSEAVPPSDLGCLVARNTATRLAVARAERTERARPERTELVVIVNVGSSDSVSIAVRDIPLPGTGRSVAE